MMKKVYLILCNIYDSYVIYCICDELEKAEKEKADLENTIKNLKQEYFLEHNSDYDEDLRLVYGEELLVEDVVKYEEVMTRFYMFQARHIELNYYEISIQDRYVI